MKRLLLKKTLESLQEEAFDEKHSLRRSIGPVNLVLLGIGVIIGAGIFVLTGQAAAQNAGPGIVLSFLLAAIACGFSGL
nr:amino acid permease [Nitrospiraceae bacterium]